MAEPNNDSNDNLRLDSLSTELLGHICRMLGNVPDLSAMELTCRRFRRLLADDMLWSAQDLGQETQTITDPRMSTYRESLSVEYTLGLVGKHQVSPKNFLVHVFEGEFPCRSWRALLGTIVQALPVPEPVSVGWNFTGEHLLCLRGDTLCTVLELMRSFLLISFQRALRIRLVRSEADASVYPVVRLEDLLEQERIVMPQDVSMLPDVFCKPYAQTEINFADSLIERAKRDAIIRLIAFQAGIPHLDNGVYQIAWTAMVEYSRLILKNVYMKICIRVPLDPEDVATSHRPPGRHLPQHWIQDNPPPPELVIDGTSIDHASRTYRHKPAPKQFMDASQYHLPYVPAKVYGFWLKDDHYGFSCCEALDDSGPIVDEYASDGSIESDEYTYWSEEADGGDEEAESESENADVVSISDVDEDSEDGDAEDDDDEEDGGSGNEEYDEDSDDSDEDFDGDDINRFCRRRQR